VAFLSGLSTDLFGQLLTHALDAANVDTALAVRSARPTTLAFVALAKGQAEYTFYDEGTAGRALCEQDLPALPDTVEAAFFGGISLLAEPCGTAYEALMARAHAAGAVTIIDPNIRPDFIRDEAATRVRLDRMLAMADIVKLSDDDLFWLFGPTSLAGAAEALLATGPKLVFITEGAAGAQAFAGGRSLRVAAQRADVVDTVGAGDTFNAGVLAALHAAGVLTRAALGSVPDKILADALTLASRAAAVTVSRAGANPPWAKEIP